MIPNNKAARILLVEDEKALRENLKLNLEMEGYDVDAAENGKDGLELFRSAIYDTIILDIMMPKMDGLTLTESIRSTNDNTPILFLSAKNTTEDKIEGLKKGADDYMVKPFELEELLLRISRLIDKAHLMRSTSQSIKDKYEFGGNEINFKSLKANNYKGEPVNLSKTEAQLLKLLIENANNVVSREHILHVVWGYDVFPNTRTIDNFILNFRKNFEKDNRNPQHFFSVRGVGYKFTP